MAFHWSAITLYCLHCDMVSQVDRIVIERVVRDSVATLVTEIMELVLGVNHVVLLWLFFVFICMRCQLPT